MKKLVPEGLILQITEKSVLIKAVSSDYSESALINFYSKYITYYQGCMQDFLSGRLHIIQKADLQSILMLHTES